MKTYILDIQRMSTEDGPGLRTSVFFKGCNLECTWCHNPESISFERQTYWIKDNCIGCLTCVNGCPNKALSAQEIGIIKDSAKCQSCFVCASECPTLAMELKGEEYTPQELVCELIKDKVYFEKSGGGITLSGGEPVLHNEYMQQLAQLIKAEGIHIALDTAGCYPPQRLEALLPYVDLVLYDIKVADSTKHKALTGVENTLIMENAKKLGAQDKALVWVRTPIIPNATDTKENIAAIGAFIKKYMPNIQKWELLAFNNLAKDKYRLLGKQWAHADDVLITKQKMQDLCELATQYTPKACWSGTTLLEVDK